MDWGFILATLIDEVSLASLAAALEPPIDRSATRGSQWRRGTAWFFICCAMLWGQRSTTAVTQWVTDYGHALALVLGYAPPRHSRMPRSWLRSKR